MSTEPGSSPSRNSRRARRQRSRTQLPLLKIPFRQLRNRLAPLEMITGQQIGQIHESSMQILENVGLRWLDDETLSLWESAGARVDHAARQAWLDRGLVMELVGQAPPSFTWRARNPQRSLTIGENAINFFPHAGMVFVTDRERGRRPGTSRDYETLLKLGQMCNVLHAAGVYQVELHDVPGSARHLRRQKASYSLSDKVVAASLHGRIISEDILAMARLVFGGDLTSGGPVTGGVVNANSPLVYDKRMLGGLISMARAGQVVIATPFVLAGAMSPVTLAAAIAQQNAEVLAGLALAQLVRPGTPVVYGAFLTNVDMKSGSPAFGTPEGALAAVVGAQLARFYKLPYRGNGGLTSANAVSAQAAYESNWSLWPAVLAHTHIIFHALGWLEGGLTVSFEKFVIDAENLAMMHHFLQEFDTSPEAFALDSIAEVGPGGHHFGTAHTRARYESAFYAPTVSDRRNYGTWQEAGAPNTLERATRIWRDLLQAYRPPPLDEDIREALAAYVARREQELAGVDLYSDE